MRLSKTRRLRVFLPALILGAASLAGAGGPGPLIPEYEVTLRDASQMNALLKGNVWAKDFSGSNLYRGSMARLGPVLFAVGSEDRDSWKGRLVDFLADHLLAHRPVRLSYFHSSGLSTPFGTTILGLSPREKEIVSRLIKSHRRAEDAEIEIGIAPNRTEKIRVTPISLRTQKFAVVAGNDCLTVSRDPRLAAALSQRCTSEPLAADASIDVDTKQFFSAWSTVVEKLFGLGPRLRIELGFDGRNARFKPGIARLALEPNHILGTAPVDDAVLAAIPADTLFFTTALLPDPTPLSKESLDRWFRSARPRGGGRAVPVTLLYLGMHEGKKSRQEALSVLLVPQKDTSEAALARIDELFGNSGRFEVHASSPCPGVVAISPSRTGLERIAAVCSGKQPSFRQLSPKVVSAFRDKPISAGAFFNAGGFLKSSLALGWRAESPAGGKPLPPLPPEVVEAMTLLDRLPMYAFAGPALGSSVVMAGVEP